MKMLCTFVKLQDLVAPVHLLVASMLCNRLCACAVVCVCVCVSIGLVCPDVTGTCMYLNTCHIVTKRHKGKHVV